MDDGSNSLYYFYSNSSSQSNDLYIKIVGILISSLIMFSTFDWAKTYETLNEVMKSFYEWLLIKSDGDEETASAYLCVSLVILSQPFILGGYTLYKKLRDHSF